jgi:hypothetical protein
LKLAAIVVGALGAIPFRDVAAPWLSGEDIRLLVKSVAA